MIYTQMQLKRAPLGYVPGCETQHDDIANVMRQVFPGGRVRLTYDKHSGRVEALVDSRSVGRWDKLTVGTWYDILYTLENDFSTLIAK